MPKKVELSSLLPPSFCFSLSFLFSHFGWEDILAQREGARNNNDFSSRTKTVINIIFPRNKSLEGKGAEGKRREGGFFTPLLASKLKEKEIFFRSFRIVKEIRWLVCVVVFLM